MEVLHIACAQQLRELCANRPSKACDCPLKRCVGWDSLGGADWDTTALPVVATLRDVIAVLELRIGVEVEPVDHALEPDDVDVHSWPTPLDSHHAAPLRHPRRHPGQGAVGHHAAALLSTPPPSVPFSLTSRRTHQRFPT